MGDRTELRTRWRRLADEIDAQARPARAWEGRLLRAYGSPLRAYHTGAHVLFLLGEIERHLGRIGDPARLRLAAFFHDFVYRTWRRDNEAASARAASAALTAFGAPAALEERVHQLILRTAGHAAPAEAEADGDDALFLDMDLAVLGAPAEAYDRYARQVRREHFWVRPSLYRRGRSAFLEAMATRPRIFNTDVYESERGAQARANMARELAGLS